MSRYREIGRVYRKDKDKGWIGGLAVIGLIILVIAASG